MLTRGLFAKSDKPLNVATAPIGGAVTDDDVLRYDRLHNGRTVQVPGHEIAPVVSAWLAELGAHSPLVEDLARAACVGDWAAAYAVGDQLSVDVTVAAAA